MRAEDPAFCMRTTIYVLPCRGIYRRRIRDVLIRTCLFPQNAEGCRLLLFSVWSLRLLCALLRAMATRDRLSFHLSATYPPENQRGSAFAFDALLLLPALPLVLTFMKFVVFVAFGERSHQFVAIRLQTAAPITSELRNASCRSSGCDMQFPESRRGDPPTSPCSHRRCVLRRRWRRAPGSTS